MKYFSSLLLALAAFALAIPVQAQTAYRPKVGEPHPDFVLPKVGDREMTALSDFRGKKVLLVHFASW